ncbi:MAG: hypothetical protein HZA00_05105 [Nitrospinae bacterium]|nr:hypothetical protein [Nitrospinota bacterium]
MTASDTVGQGFSLAYTYDSTNRLTKIDASPFEKGGLRGIFSFTYDTSGRRTKLTYPNEVTTTYSYDTTGNLTNLLTQYTELQNKGKKKPPNPVPAGFKQGLKLHTLDSFTYTHDKVGNRLSKTEAPSTLAGEGRGEGEVKYTYSYDAIYRLLQSTPTKLWHNGKEKEFEHKAETFTYDPVGNRLTGPKEKLNYTYNEGNQLSELTKQPSPPSEGGDKGVVYTYDKNGNLTKKLKYDDDGNIKIITFYTYDFENRLTRVEMQKDGKEKIIEFTYDPFGRRLAKVIHRHEIEDEEDGDDEEGEHSHPRATYYVYDNEDIIMEYNHKGKITARYVHGLGIDEPLAIDRKGKTYYYHFDGLGSVTALTDAKGKVVQRYDYDSFGNLKHHGHKVKQPYTYTAREYDRETGLYYYRARYYDPKMGRFISKDPFPGLTNLPQTLNHYSYVGNNPVKFIDPFGLSSLTYNFNTGSLSLYDSGGSLIGQFPAGNNTTIDSNGSWPPGTYPYSYYVPHPESGPTGRYGSHGNFVFDVPGRQWMGVHSGRQNPQSLTQGCIRTTDEATQTIKNLNTTDPLTSITVR